MICEPERLLGNFEFRLDCSRYSLILVPLFADLQIGRLSRENSMLLEQKRFLYYKIGTPFQTQAAYVTKLIFRTSETCRCTGNYMHALWLSSFKRISYENTPKSDRRMYLYPDFSTSVFIALLSTKTSALTFSIPVVLAISRIL